MANTLLSVFVSLAFSYLVYYVFLIIYRLTLHPLARFPGPKLAASSKLYEMYHDGVRHGKLVFKLQDLHDTYGPIVRITPGELHIRDSRFYDELYANRHRKQDKDAGWVKFSVPNSFFSTVGHDLHRQRRAPVAPFFSKRSVNELEPVLRSKVEQLCARFAEKARAGEVVYCDAAFTALTSDVISDFAFGQSWDQLYKPDFGLDWMQVLRETVKTAQFMRFFPWMVDVMNMIPMPVVYRIAPPVYALLRWRERAIEEIVEICEGRREGKESGRKTVFHDIRDSDMPKSELEPVRLADEAIVFVTAGTETTATVLLLILYFMLSAPESDYQKKLADELRDNGVHRMWSEDKALLAHLESLPFLVQPCQFLQ